MPKFASDGSQNVTIVAGSTPAGSALIGGVQLVDSGGTNKATIDAYGAQFTYLAAEYTPPIVQKQQNKSTGSVASLAKAFDSAVTAGNTIVVQCGCGNGTAMTVADSLGNTYYQAVNSPNSTTFEAAIFYSVITTAGTPTVTVTNAGAAASMAMEIYEVRGTLAVASNQPDVFSKDTGTSGTATAPTMSPTVPNGIAFMCVAVGTAAQAVSATSGTFWTLDSTQNTTTPAGLFTFGALSQSLGGLLQVLPKATIASSEPYAVAAAVFRPISLAVQGTTGCKAITAYSTTQTAINTTGNSGDIDVSVFRELDLDVNLTQLTGTSVAFKIERKDAAGNYVSLYAPAALTGASSIAQTIGVGAETNKGFGGTVKITWTCTVVTTTTFTVSLIGK